MLSHPQVGETWKTEILKQLLFFKSVLIPAYVCHKCFIIVLTTVYKPKHVLNIVVCILYFQTCII